MEIVIRDGPNESTYQAKSLGLVYLDEDGTPQFQVRGSVPFPSSLLQLLLLRLMK